MGRHGRSIAAALVAAAVGVALCATAGAETVPGTAVSANWSGFVQEGGPYAVTTATFNVPNLTAASTETSTSEWIGLDGTDPHDHSLIQAGVAETYDPAANLVHLHAWWEILPALETVVPLPVAVGDRVSVSIARVDGRHWRIEIKNLTQRRRFVTTQAYGGPARTADWIVEAPSDRHGRIKTLGHYVPDVTFANLRLAGKQGAMRPHTMVQHGVVVSEVSRRQTNAFSVAYR